MDVGQFIVAHLDGSPCADGLDKAEQTKDETTEEKVEDGRSEVVRRWVCDDHGWRKSRRRCVDKNPEVTMSAAVDAR